MFGESEAASASLQLELHPENSRAVGAKLLMLILGVFFVVLPATGLTIYFWYESAYIVQLATAVCLLSFVAVIYWSTNSSKSVYQVDISATGFSMFATKISPFMTPVNGWYKWEDIAYYTYEHGDENSKLKLNLYLNAGQCLTFYYLGFEEYGDLPKFYHILCQHLPGKERKM